MLNKVKKGYDRLKELWAIPNMKSIILLCFWFVFILFLIFFTRSLSHNSALVKENFDKSFDNYKFTITNNNLFVFGENYGGKLEFVIGKNHYYYNGNNVYLINNHNMVLVSNFNLSVLKITPSMINNLISNLSYTLIGGVREYTASLSRFISLYDIDVAVDLSLADQYNIILRVYQTNNEIYRYELDLTNYYNFKNLNNEGILVIDIYGSAHDFTKYYDKLIGGVV